MVRAKISLGTLGLRPFYILPRLSNMAYYRLRDIKTPPFAYVVNKEEVIRSCSLCQMPLEEMNTPLEVEICASESSSWQERIHGRPLMADHWLIGDEDFGTRLKDLVPGGFDQTPIRILSWLTRSPMALLAEPGDPFKVQVPQGRPNYFYFKPKQQIRLASSLLASFPPIRCCECERDIPEIPIDVQPIPEVAGEVPLAASLQGLYLEGYDYLFSAETAVKLERLFPEMILEKLVPEPMVI